jgi:hypothetical protein
MMPHKEINLIKDGKEYVININNGIIFWRLKNDLIFHREDGPAIVYGKLMEWWLYGQRFVINPEHRYNKARTMLALGLNKV